MQILEKNAGLIQLDISNETVVKFQKISETTKLRDAILNFNLNLTISPGERIVFLNKRGMIRNIRLFQSGKQILELLYQNDRMELLCETQFDSNNKHYGNLFFQRIKNQQHNIPQLPNYQIQGYTDQYLDQVAATGLLTDTISYQDFPTTFNIADIFMSEHNGTLVPIEKNYKNIQISLYPYFMHTFVDSNLNSGFLFIKDLEIEITFSPIQEFCYLESSTTKGISQKITVGTQSQYDQEFILDNLQLFIPHHENIQLEYGTKECDFCESMLKHQYENVDVKIDQKQTPIKKIYFQQKHSNTIQVYGLLNNFLISKTNAENTDMLQNSQITLKTLSVNGKKIFYDFIDMASPQYTLFLKENLKSATDYKKNLLQTLMKTNVIAIDFINEMRQKYENYKQHINIQMVQNDDFYMFVYYILQKQITQTPSGILV